MGMFDYVVCEAPLPDGWRPGEMQSKDLDCSMTTVRISAEGRLLIERYETYTVPKKERPYPDAADGSALAICGMVGKRERRWEDLEYHGDFNFYGDGQVGEPQPILRAGRWFYERQRVWHEYVARFTDGQLVSIRAIHDDALAAATGTAETRETAAQCEASQSGPAKQGNAHTSVPLSPIKEGSK